MLNIFFGMIFDKKLSKGLKRFFQVTCSSHISIHHCLCKVLTPILFTSILMEVTNQLLTSQEHWLEQDLMSSCLKFIMTYNWNHDNAENSKTPIKTLLRSWSNATRPLERIHANIDGEVNNKYYFVIVREWFGYLLEYTKRLLGFLNPKFSGSVLDKVI